MGCGTQNQLIALYTHAKVSEPEIKWLKANLLNESELAQLNTIKGTKQGNLFDQAINYFLFCNLDLNHAQYIAALSW